MHILRSRPFSDCVKRIDFHIKRCSKMKSANKFGVTCLMLRSIHKVTMILSNTKNIAKPSKPLAKPKSTVQKHRMNPCLANFNSK